MLIQIVYSETVHECKYDKRVIGHIIALVTNESLVVCIEVNQEHVSMLILIVH